ncbi:MAG: hypothetical protein IKN78_10400 [Bacteroidales bacterium]|nr:hypothetical protein [Bacteroidales bacterium]
MVDVYDKENSHSGKVLLVDVIASCRAQHAISSKKEDKANTEHNMECPKENSSDFMVHRGFFAANIPFFQTSKKYLLYQNPTKNNRFVPFLK